MLKKRIIFLLICPIFVQNLDIQINVIFLLLKKYYIIWHQHWKENMNFDILKNKIWFTNKNMKIYDMRQQQQQQFSTKTISEVVYVIFIRGMIWNKMIDKRCIFIPSIHFDLLDLCQVRKSTNCLLDC